MNAPISPIDTLLTAQGDIAMQFNSGAASLPWAAVRFVLQVAMNDQKYLENMMEGIQTVVEMIATYAVVETLYLDQEFDLQDQIRNKVVGLYVHILSFLGEGVEYYQQSLLSKFSLSALFKADLCENALYEVHYIRREANACNR
jgi:hypothetical protein